MENLQFEQLRTEAKLNLIPIAVLTRLFLEKFLKRGSRSGIINLSSAASMFSYKGTAHYSATKTYDDFFSRALEPEVRHKVDVLTVRPFYVTTPMTKKTTSFMHSTAEQTAKEAINSLGNTDICYGPLMHRIQGALVKFASPKIVSKITSMEIESFK